ncbi:hypothetical protein FRB97_001558 [Tulasnella sp. 331]|nr:hypothetical protein FRB97_001558 [Tulasnella sp. 331]
MANRGDNDNTYSAAEAVQAEIQKHPADIDKAEGVVQAPQDDCLTDYRLPHDASVFVAKCLLDSLPAGPQDFELETILKSHFSDIAKVTKSVKKVLEFFGPISHLHPHRSSWHPSVFLPHPAPLPLHLPINGPLTASFVGPWEVKFESRDDAVCAKRTLEQIPNLFITWVHAHPRPFSRTHRPWLRSSSDVREAGSEECPQPSVSSNNHSNLTGRPALDEELSAADLRDSFKFPPRPTNGPFDHLQHRHLHVPKRRSEPAATLPIQTMAPRMTEVEFPPLDDAHNGPDKDPSPEKTSPKVARPSFARVIAPVIVEAGHPPSEAGSAIPQVDVGRKANVKPVIPVKDGKSLYVPHLSKAKGWTVQRLESIFSAYEGFEKAILKKRGQKAWYGLIDFHNHELATKALNTENGREHFGVVFQLAYHRLYPRKDVSSSVRSITPVLLTNVKTSGEQSIPFMTQRQADEPRSTTGECCDVAVQTGDQDVQKVSPTASEPSHVASTFVCTGNASSDAPTNLNVELSSLTASPFLNPLQDTSHISQSSPMTVKQDLPQESSVGPTPVNHPRASKASHRRSSSDPHVHFNLPASVLNVTKDVGVAQLATQERRASAGRETIGGRDAPSLTSSPMRLRDVESGKGMEGASVGRRTPSWGTTVEESGLSSPEARSVTSSDAGTAEIVSGGEGRQPETDLGVWPSGGLVYMLPPSDSSRTEGYPRQVPQAKGFVETEHGLLPIYSPEALAPYARESFPVVYPPIHPVDMVPWVQHTPPYAPGWGSGGCWMPGMGMPTPMPYGTPTSGSPVVPPFAQQQVPGYSHTPLPLHNPAITPSVPAYVQTTPHQPPAGRGRRQSSQYRRNNGQRNHQNHPHQHLYRHHQSDTFDHLNAVDPAIYYQHQHQHHQQNGLHQNPNQPQHSPPQYNLNQQYPYYIPDQHTYPSIQQQPVYQTEATAPAYV